MFSRTSLFSSAIRSLNRVTLIGAMHEVQCGFIGAQSVFQFTLTCAPLDGGKDPFAVRCFGGDALTAALREHLEDGSVVRVVGRLKTTESAEGVSSGRKFSFPCVMVEFMRGGEVALLHSPRRQRRNAQLQEAIAKAAKTPDTTECNAEGT